MSAGDGHSGVADGADASGRCHAALVAEVPEGSRALWIGAMVPDPALYPSLRRVHVDALQLLVGGTTMVDAGAPPALRPSTAPSDLPPGPYDVVVCSFVDLRELGRLLPRLHDVMTEGGRVAIGFGHAASAAHALSLLGSTAVSSSVLATGTTLPMVIATLAASGYVVESTHAIPAHDDAPVRSAASECDELLATAPDASVDYYVVNARQADIETARRLARRRLERIPHRGPERRAVDAVAYDALLRHEQQFVALERSLGWRLLGHYGPYKYRFVLPVWRAVQHCVRRLWRRFDDRRATQYDQWARFADAFHQGTTVGPAADAPSDDSALVVSVVMTVGEASLADICAAVSSVLRQRYRQWELCLASVGDAGLATTRAMMERLAVIDSRVLVDPTPHATDAAASNAALVCARGTVVAMTASAVELAPDALSVAVRALTETGGDLVYADEDLRDEHGRRHSPQLKPGWSPDLLLSWMYWSRLVVYRRSVLQRVGPLRAEFEGATHYDLALRATEERARIVHAPRILAHACSAPTPTGGPPTTAAADAGRRALQAALVRRGIVGSVHGCADGVYRVQRTVVGAAKVTIIVPTRDGLAMLQRCLRAVEATDHSRYEVVIVDNGSVEPATLEFLAATHHTVLRAPGPFNFSQLNNGAVARTTGEYLVFLNDDTEACSPDWLRALEEHAQRPEVGAVGAKLLYPNGRIQHAGIAVGIGGLVGHPHRFQRRAPPGIRNVSAVTAACLMMRRETFETVGRFDERLPVNSNDVDLCLRLRDRGYLVVYTPHAVLYHHESATRGVRTTPDDAWLMTRRWRSALLADPYYSPNAERAVESGTMDLSKPDGFVCLYAGPPAAVGSVRAEPGTTIGQNCFVTDADLCAIVLHVRVEGDRSATALRLRIRDAPDATTDVRVVDRAVTGRTDDERWFCFDPIPHSGGRRWYFSIEASGPHAFAAARTAVISDVMGPCFENDAPTHGMLSFQLYARAPYRCVTSPP